MTNHDYWQALVGDQSPEDFLRTYGTADPELGLARFLEDRGHFYGVLNQGTWEGTFGAENQCHVLTARVYLLSYLDETREEWQPPLDARPPKVVRRYKPVYDFPVANTPPADEEAAEGHVDSDQEEETTPESVTDTSAIESEAGGTSDAAAEESSNRSEVDVQTAEDEAEVTQSTETDPPPDEENQGVEFAPQDANESTDDETNPSNG